MLSPGEWQNFPTDLADGFDISIAAQGLKRPRFMAKAPTAGSSSPTCITLADNSLGAIYILTASMGNRASFNA